MLADSANGNIGFSYDNLDRVTQITTPKGIVNYTYDANSRRSSMTVAGQPTQSYSYDDAGRLLRIDQAPGAINNNQAQNIQFVYDDAGRLTKTTYANGITRDNSYDDAGQLTGITYKKADNSLIGDLTYTYDANGRRTKTSGSLAKTDLPDTISTASYDANNRLATWGSQILHYDANGNLTSDGLKTYIWNARNQLIQIKDSTGTEVASFSYDALGRRQNKTINGVSTGFMYDGVNIVQELNGASPINNYVSAGVDQVFVQQSGSGPSASSLTYLTDALGSTIRLTNAAGDKVVDYSYDPYGNTKVDAVINNAFQYTGRENDGNGLYYYRARYYAPATHRFISEDPIGLNGGINGYGYVGGNPVSFIDPLGLQAGRRYDTVEGQVAGFDRAFKENGVLDCAGMTGMELGINVLSLASGAGDLAAGVKYLAIALKSGGKKVLRGVSGHGGIFSSLKNAAGGEVWTATGKISQNDFATYVNSGLYKGDVHIISGVHGTPSGTTMADLSLFKADVAKFGSMPGVNVYNFVEMTPQQITNLLRGPGTTIGGFCDSGACLAPFK